MSEDKIIKIKVILPDPRRKSLIWEVLRYKDGSEVEVIRDGRYVAVGDIRCPHLIKPVQEAFEALIYELRHHFNKMLEK